ncbi:MAG: pantoate--beta-alanine ligase [Cyanobacteria bacterium REEB67]|nr:pantoate--beta-alanine ligase [Cyanobacteria bacterium REEB67]
MADSLSKLKEWRVALNSPWLHDGQDAAAGGVPTLGFVPTMGALHDGHLELVRRARASCDKVLVSIFVNPYQFAPTEDFSKYPRTFERDLALLTEAGVDCVFYPSEAEMYPHGRDGIVSVLPPSPLNDTLEGAFRPTFFRGVATIVLKLFTLVQPHRAYFGEKDYQQLLVIEALCRDLNLPVEIVPVQTVREADGLAMSSRNAYLDVEKRQLAPVLHTSLLSVVEASLAGVELADALQSAKKRLGDEARAAELEVELQYLSVCHATTLEPLDRFVLPFVVLVAAKLGEVRLIDNVVVRG